MIKKTTMLTRIGILSPRSTDYPSMGYDILDGMKYRLKLSGNEHCQFFIENIGFGEDHDLNFAKAEKLIIQDNVDVIIMYAGAANAASLYPLAEALQKPVIILDAGMQYPQVKPSSYCFHISLQGLHACRIAGNMAGSGHRKVLMAISHYDGGYRGPFSGDRGLSEAGGSVCGNYISTYKKAAFNIDAYIELLERREASAVAAHFSSYLAELFFQALHDKSSNATPLPFYCSPFMAEEQLLNKCDFPGGEFHAVVPWSSSIRNDAQEQFAQTIHSEKNKPANIFHLLGWEAAIVAAAAAEHGVAHLKKFSYQSPRGLVLIHPDTHHTYAPLYKGMITRADNGKCVFSLQDVININGRGHLAVLNDQPRSLVSGWKNNYLCI
jgi:branched-chain amino acid transport system substrate-binding protein